MRGSRTLLAATLAAALLVPTTAAAQQPRGIDNACPPGEVPQAGFTDIAGNPHERAINCLAMYGITGGITPDTYGPALPVRRDQMASFIARFLGRFGAPLPPDPPHRFGDVSPDSPHALAINQLAELGVVGGFADGTYQPAAAVRRDQMATFLNNAFAQVVGEPLSSDEQFFTDIAGNVHAPNINALAEQGIVAGFGDGRYGPAEQVRRDQMASFVMRTGDLLVSFGTFTSVWFVLLTGANVLDDSGAEPVFGRGEPGGVGFAFVILSSETGRACVTGFIGAAGPFTGHRIHLGSMVENGPALVSLPVPEADGVVDGCTTGDAAAIADLERNPRGYHLTVATQNHPDGAVRGQFDVTVSVTDPHWMWVVDDAGAEPTFGQGERGASSIALLQFDRTTGVACSAGVVWDATEPFTGHHIHRGGMDENGPTVISFPEPAPSLNGVAPFGECLRGGTSAVAAVEEDPDGHYISITTDDYPAGAVRGQLGAFMFEASLSGEAVVVDGQPGQGEPDATGLAGFQVSIDTGELCFYLETDATPPYTDAHIHGGSAGATGPPVIDLEAPGPDGVGGGCTTVPEGLAVDVFLAPEDYYAQIHSVGYPDGAVRGQLDVPPEAGDGVGGVSATPAHAMLLAAARGL